MRSAACGGERRSHTAKSGLRAFPLVLGGPSLLSKKRIRRSSASRQGNHSLTAMSISSSKRPASSSSGRELVLSRRSFSSATGPAAFVLAGWAREGIEERPGGWGGETGR